MVSIVKSLLVAATTVTVLSGCATADRAQMADVISTYAVLQQGFNEANPLLSDMSIPQMAAVKLGVTQVVKFLPDPVCAGGLWALTGLGYGATLWNIGVMVGSGPAAIPFALGLWWWQSDNWMASSHRTCADPFHFEPPVFMSEAHNDQK
jgi:hypothetical protein